ncbi:uncharacterized protein LOC130447854 [Diorhabda sublineata]|uniref:uncharacterized protein LOC130447854 n=1 Tax=Diorhabda sublineata TaxID=1163346 RepID=UPI0024E10B16|nr:uncharacterized protein LOC130447854 [Diorhabda sublineata]
MMDARESTQNQIVFLDRGDYTTCTIFLHGCTILSWRIHNEEQIFLSRVSPLSQYHYIRGGIRLIWPHYSTWSFGRFNGFARDILWTVIRGPESLPNGDVFVDVSSSSEYYTKSMWCFDFELIYRITLHFNQLTLSVTIKNTSKYFNYDFNAVLQANIKINDIKDVKIVGLENCSYVDIEVPRDSSLLKVTSEETVIDKHINRAYQDTPDVIDVYTASNKLLKITKHNLPDVNVWNPGQEIVRKIHDIGNTYPFYS